MTYTVITSHLDEHKVEASIANVDPGGHLALMDAQGAVVALYAPGQWSSATRTSTPVAVPQTIVHQTISSGPQPAAAKALDFDMRQPYVVPESDNDSPTRADDTVAEPEPPAAEEPKPAKAAVKRRRTRAQKEEDERDGLDDAFQKALKEHPDLDVDTLRDMIRGNREAADSEAAAAGHVAEGDEVGDIVSGVDNAPAVTADAFDPPSAETPDEQPTGVAPTTSAGWNPPWAQ